MDSILMAMGSHRKLLNREVKQTQWSARLTWPEVGAGRRRPLKGSLSWAVLRERTGKAA